MPAVPPKSQSSRKDQDAVVDMGLSCLVMIARFLQMAVDGVQLTHHFASHEKSVDSNDLVRAPLYLKFNSHRSNGLIQDSSTCKPQVFFEKELDARWTGQLILITHRSVLTGMTGN